LPRRTRERRKLLSDAWGGLGTEVTADGAGFAVGVHVICVIVSLALANPRAEDQAEQRDRGGDGNGQDQPSENADRQGGFH
jgi:hypothetical protein